MAYRRPSGISGTSASGLDHSRTRINMTRQVVQSENGPYLWLPLNIPMPDYPGHFDDIDSETPRRLREKARDAAVTWMDAIDRKLANDPYPTEMRIMCITAVTAQLRLDLDHIPLDSPNILVFWGYLRDELLNDPSVRGLALPRSVERR